MTRLLRVLNLVLFQQTVNPRRQGDEGGGRLCFLVFSLRCEAAAAGQRSTPANSWSRAALPAEFTRSVKTSKDFLKFNL